MVLSAQAIAAMAAVKRVHFLNEGAIRSNKSIGDAAGLKHLGVHLTTVQPGHRSTEYHFHHYEEECVYVLSGSGTVVIGEQTQKIGPGDFMGHALDHVAHEMINDGTEPMVYIGMSAPQGVDIVEYPDSDKVSSSVGAPPNTKRYIFKKGTQVEYFEGDKDA